MAIGGVQLWRESGNQLSRGSSFRAQFNETSVRMMAARPLVGVGIGQYYQASTLFLTPELAWSYGSENAHNYFLQIGAELGVPGLVLFTAFIAAAIWRGIRALAVTPRDVRLLGVFCGVAAFVATCFVSHPLLVEEVAFPFWAQFGLLLGLAGSALYDRVPLTTMLTTSTTSSDEALDRAPRMWRPPALATAAAIAYVVVAAPFSAYGRDIAPPASRAVDGFYEWEVDADGTPFRWTEQYASLFVPAGVMRIDIPIRIPTGLPGLRPVEVRASIGGRARPPEPAGGAWSMLSLDVPPVQPPMRFQRINLRVERTLQPALYIPGSADFRTVGVQVGKVNLVR
jgi:hypothetical protein